MLKLMHIYIYIFLCFPRNFNFMNSYRFIMEDGNNLVCFLKTLLASFTFPVQFLFGMFSLIYFDLLQKTQLLHTNSFQISNYSLWQRSRDGRCNGVFSLPFFTRDHKQQVLYKQDQLVTTLFHFTGLKVGKNGFHFHHLQLQVMKMNLFFGFSCTLVSATAVVRIKKVFSGHLIGEKSCTGSAILFGFTRPLVLGNHRPFHVLSLLKVSTNSLKTSCAYTVPDLPFVI